MERMPLPWWGCHCHGGDATAMVGMPLLGFGSLMIAYHSCYPTLVHLRILVDLRMMSAETGFAVDVFAYHDNNICAICLLACRIIWSFKNLLRCLLCLDYCSFVLALMVLMVLMVLMWP